MTPQEHIRATNVLRYARNQGLDPIGILDTYGMLNTAARLRDIKLDALKEFRQQLLEHQPHEYVRNLSWTQAATADDMFKAIALHLDNYIKMQEEEG